MRVVKQLGNSNKVCPNCGRKMKQQFIGLQHCKCGMSWKKDAGFFERTGDMVFALERRVVRRSKNSVKTKQFPVIRYKSEASQKVEAENNMGATNHKGKAGYLYPMLVCDGKEYARIKVGDAGDMYEGGNANTKCTDCGAWYGNSHYDACDCERCPVCGGQLLSCGCNINVVFKKG